MYDGKGVKLLLFPYEMWGSAVTEFRAFLFKDQKGIEIK